MLVVKQTNCTVTYYPQTIVLQGQPEEVHKQADTIIKRFAFSPKPYRVMADTEREVVLTARH